LRSPDTSLALVVEVRLGPQSGLMGRSTQLLTAETAEVVETGGKKENDGK